MINPEQKMRFTDHELSLIKVMFAEKDEFLYALRKVLLQFEPTEHEAQVIKKGLNDDAMGLIKKVFCPTIDPEAPIFQLTDIAVGLGADIRDKHIELAEPYIKAKALEIDYINQQVAVIEGIYRGKEVKNSISLKELANLKVTKTNIEQLYVNITARNYLLSFIDSNIQQVKFLAGLREETVEQTKERLLKNSSK